MDNTGFTSRYWFDKQPWEDPMSYWSRSPLSLVGSITTPTLVVVGSEDYRTPPSESEQLYAALQIKGVPTALVKVPGASHGGFTARPSQSGGEGGGDSGVVRSLSHRPQTTCRQRIGCRAGLNRALALASLGSWPCRAPTS